MRIKTVKISNFRAIKQASIEFDYVTTFIGPNGVGKSTVLRALDWFFNRGRGQELTDDDYSYGSEDDEISVQVTFTDLSPKDRTELGRYVTDEATTFNAWKVHRASGEEILSANTKGYPPFNEIKSAIKAADKKSLYASLREDNPALDLPQVSTVATIEAAMSDWELNNGGALENVPENLETNFFGFNSNAKMSGLFDFVLVTADLRATEESADSKSSIVGRILERSIDRTAADEAISKLIEKHQNDQTRIFNSTFNDQLSDLTDSLNSVVNRYAPDRKIKVTPSEIDLKPPKTSFSLSVLDGDVDTPIENQGHGFQRTLLISALQVLAESGVAGEQGVICLAIEEPELFQHPIQAQTFARVLRDLAEQPDQAIQVAYATHSPYFVEPESFHQVRRLTRKDSTSPDAQIHSATVCDVVNRLDGVVDESVVRSQLDSAVANTLSLPVFANAALVVEGTTEQAVFYGVGDRDHPGKFESEGLAIVAANGKNNVPFMHAILSLLGIPTYAVFDADGRCKDKNRRQNETENSKIFRYFGTELASFPPTGVFTDFAVFEDNLETLLSESWGEWINECTRRSSEDGIDFRKNQLLYRAATASAKGNPSSVLIEILNKIS